MNVNINNKMDETNTSMTNTMGELKILLKNNKN
jgi:hypothetical protein